MEINLRLDKAQKKKEVQIKFKLIEFDLFRLFLA